MIDVALRIALLVLVLVGIVAGIALTRMAVSVSGLARRADERLVPLLDKADSTLDAVNAEIRRVDRIVGQFENVSDRVDATARAANDAVAGPAAALSGLTAGARRFFEVLFQRE